MTFDVEPPDMGADPDPLPGLDERHLHMLRAESSITDGVIKARGYFTATTKAQLAKCGFGPSQQIAPALVMPMWSVDGRELKPQIRPDNPRSVKDRPVKYETLFGNRVELDVHPSMLERLKDPTAPLWITEGLKKGDSNTSRGICTISLIGVWNWKSNGPLPEWDSIPLQSRLVYLAFDSDSLTNDHVKTAVKRLAAFLGRKGAKVRYIFPPTPDGRKVGLDDYYAAGGTPTELMHSASSSFPGDAPGEPAHKPSEKAETDLGNAELMIERFGEDLRYCHKWNCWLNWDGKRWARDEHGGAIADQLARKTMMEMLETAIKNPDPDKRARLCKHALNSQHIARRNAMTSWAKSLEGIPVTPDNFDVMPFIVNCLNGTLELGKEPKLSEHKREDLITHIAPCNYDPTADCPQFIKFFGDIFDNRQELMRYVWKVLGCTLSGAAGYSGVKILIFMHGEKADNGKSTFSEIMLRVFGDYGRKIRIETLLAKPITESGSAANEDIAKLKGARFVVATEVPEGSRLNESLIKDLTGGDPITARELYQSSFTFKPQFIPWMYGNHRPGATTDKGIWSRIKEIPFDVVFTPDRRISGLPELLWAERDGIFTWLVEGCAAWLNEGLTEPDIVRSKIEEYHHEVDVLGLFLSECTTECSGSWIPCSDLYDKYKSWCKTNGLHIMSVVAFGKKMANRGERSKPKPGNSAFKVYMDRALPAETAADDQEADQS